MQARPFTSSLENKKSDAKPHLPLLEDKPKSAEGPVQVQVGSSVNLDHLGPIVINVDGTMSRIENWSNMTPFEQAQVQRIIPRRNAERLAALRAQQNSQNEN